MSYIYFYFEDSNYSKKKFNIFTIILKIYKIANKLEF